MASVQLIFKSWTNIGKKTRLHCDVPYHEHPTSFFKKLADQRVQIQFTGMPPPKVELDGI